MLLPSQHSDVIHGEAGVAVGVGGEDGARRRPPPRRALLSGEGHLQEEQSRPLLLRLPPVSLVRSDPIGQLLPGLADVEGAAVAVDPVDELPLLAFRELVLLGRAVSGPESADGLGHQLDADLPGGPPKSVGRGTGTVSSSVGDVYYRSVIAFTS